MIRSTNAVRRKMSWINPLTGLKKGWAIPQTSPLNSSHKQSEVTLLPQLSGLLKSSPPGWIKLRGRFPHPVRKPPERANPGKPIRPPLPEFWISSDAWGSDAGEVLVSSCNIPSKEYSSPFSGKTSPRPHWKVCKMQREILRNAADPGAPAQNRSLRHHGAILN